MQLRLDSADRLVELVEARRGPVPAEDAARDLYALAHVPVGLARTLLAEIVESDARLSWRGNAVTSSGLAGADLLLEDAAYVVVDLETTGLSPGQSRICEIGAARIERLEQAATFQTLVRPGERLPAAVAALTGLADAELRCAPPPGAAVRRFLAFAGDAVIVAHNARFDLAFLDREVDRLTGLRIAGPVVDTVWLARRLLAGRTSRCSLAALSHFFGTATRPCHRALPDAEATAEILLALIGLAQERGARTVAELCDLATPQTRRVHAKRRLVHGAPPRPGVYFFRDERGTVLYVGKARDLRARLRSYFGTGRQRPSVEAALAAVERIDWRVLGSELEAALEESRLIRELRPPANARGKRPQVYLRRRGEGWVVSEKPGGLGPLTGRKRTRLAARALEGFDRPEDALPDLRRRLGNHVESLRYEDAARLRDRIAALEQVAARLRELERLRTIDVWLVVPAVEEGFRRAYLVTGGRVAAERTLPPGAGARLELDAGLAAARLREGEGDADDLLLIGSFLRRPPPELEVIPAAVRRAA
jgi:DNA polymerase III epsilon subunit family exonuclease